MESKSHIVLREAIKNFTQFENLFNLTGNDSVSHAGLTLSFFDLKKIILAYTPTGFDESGKPMFPKSDPFKLSFRKKEAIYYNVIRDLKQKDVAAIMGITTVSVGQYVDSACVSIAQILFSEKESDALQGFAR
jgi:predicted DNA-binding protein (UPF0251 family)